MSKNLIKAIIFRQESGAERIIKTEPNRTDEPSVLIESQEQSVPKKQNDINGEETDEVELNSKIVTPEKVIFIF